MSRTIAYEHGRPLEIMKYGSERGRIIEPSAEELKQACGVGNSIGRVVVQSQQPLGALVILVSHRERFSRIQKLLTIFLIQRLP